MFSFFGAFTNGHVELAESFRKRWLDADIVEINEPFKGLAIRFQTSVYRPQDEDLPIGVSTAIQEISEEWPNTRFVLLRTECWGGDCENWGEVVAEGRIVATEAGQDALRKLVGHLGGTLGPSAIFQPLSRSFPWRIT